MSICNHNKGKNCKLCYPVYDDEMEAKVEKLYKETLEFNKELKKGHYYGGGVKGSSKVNVLLPDETGVSPSPIHHHVKKNVGFKGVRFY